MDSESTILYVEDDPFSRQVMELILTRKMKFRHVTIFDSSDDFMDRLQELPQRPDLIFLDIHMEPHDGFALLNMVRAHGDYDETIIVAVTASVMNEEVDQLKSAGFDSVVAKPIDQQTFPDILTRILSGERIWTVM